MGKYPEKLDCSDRALSEFISSQVNYRKVEARMSSLNDLEFAFAPLRDTVRDLREYL